MAEPGRLPSAETNRARVQQRLKTERSAKSLSESVQVAENALSQKQAEEEVETELKDLNPDE